MRILWVKSGGLVPLDHGGRIRSYQIARELARRNEVTLFTFYAEQPDDPHHELSRIFARVIAMPLAIPPAKSMGDYARYSLNLFSNQPYSMRKYCQPQVAERLRQHLLENQYDAIICDFLLTAAVIPWDVPCPKILFTHNIEAVIWERHFRTSKNPVWKAVCYREYRMMEKLERKYIQRADHVLAVSEVDRDFFARFSNPAKISVIPTGVDIDYFQPAPEQGQLNRLVFTGSMDWLPNEDGILFFVEKILPRIRSRIPGASFWVVGRRPSAHVKELADRVPDVHVTGTVDDIRPYVLQSSVYVVPLLVGGGTRLKIFEAMAAGKAVVSTTIGAEGLPVTHGTNIILADEPDRFADEVVNLLSNAKKRAELGQAARSLVEENYSWGAVAQQLETVLAQLSRKSTSEVAQAR